MDTINWVGCCGTTDASSLGLPPGRFPDRLHLARPDGHMLEFRRSATTRDSEGELVSVTYITEHYNVVIFND
jgi:hypothetical protein